LRARRSRSSRRPVETLFGRDVHSRKLCARAAGQRATFEAEAARRSAPSRICSVAKRADELSGRKTAAVQTVALPLFDDGGREAARWEPSGQGRGRAHVH
jgi:hypothetical protein